VEYLGRIAADLQVKIRGFRIEPGEVESAIRDTALARDAVVIARADGDAPAALAAYIVTDSVPDLTALRDALADRIPAYMIPATFTPLPAIPLTANGKLDRAALPRPEAVRHGGRPLETGLETTIALAWSDVLERADIGPDDNFFELGGTSLSLIRLSSLLAAHGAEPLGIGDLFAAPTVRSQAARMRRAADAPVVLHRIRLDRATDAKVARIDSAQPWFAERSASAAYAFLLALESSTRTTAPQLLVWRADGLALIDVPEPGAHIDRLSAMRTALDAPTPVGAGGRLRFTGVGSLPALRLPDADGTPDRLLLDEIDVLITLDATAAGSSARLDARAGSRQQGAALLRRFALLLDRLAAPPPPDPAEPARIPETTSEGTRP
jgi:hypothetical protein